MTQRTPPGAVTRHPLMLQGKQETQFKRPQIGSLGNRSTTPLPGQFREHPDHQWCWPKDSAISDESVDLAPFADIDGGINQRAALRWEEVGMWNMEYGLLTWSSEMDYTQNIRSTLELYCKE